MPPIFENSPYPVDYLRKHVGTLKLQDWTLQDWTQTDGVARVDIAGLNISGRVCESELGNMLRFFTVGLLKRSQQELESKKVLN